MNVILVTALAAAFALSAKCPAQGIPAQPDLGLPFLPADEAPPGSGLILPAHTEVLLRVATGLNSSQIRQGTTFAMAVVRDVRVGTTIVIPRGTPASAILSYRTGKASFGKSAKIEFAVREIILPQQSIDMRGKYRIEGDGNANAALGAVVAGGVIGGLLVTGHSAVIAPGTEFIGYTFKAVRIAAAAAGPAAAGPAGQ